MTPPVNSVSLENPTWEFLNSNYRKTELQKHCRDIGITKVWVTKDKLIEMIMEKHRSSRPCISETIVQDQEITPHATVNGVEELRERMNVRESEIEELNELLKTAHVTINKLNDRLSSLEEQVKQLQETNTQQLPPALQGSSSSPHSRPEGALLLGDTNLTSVRSFDLGDQCSVRTIKEADIDLTKCWIAEKLNWTPKYCILYCGLQDILDRSSLEDIFDRLGSLVTSLKQVNEDMIIHICELVPIPRVQEFDEDINNFNNQLATWSTVNGVKVIKTNLQFRLGTGEVDRLCFYSNKDDNQGNFLNRFGVIRLLNVINQQCSFFNLHTDWDNVTSQEIPSLPSSSSKSSTRNGRNSQSTTANERKRNDRAPSGENRTSTSGYGRYDYQPAIGNENRYHPRPQTRRQHINGRRNSQYSSGDDHRGQHGSFPNGEWNRNSSAVYTNSYYGQSQPGTRPRQRLHGELLENPSRRHPCHNCGESNHDLSKCHFDHRIRCGRCKVYGHKTRLCQSNE